MVSNIKQQIQTRLSSGFQNAVAVLFATAVVFAVLFQAGKDVGLNLWDPGYLWYGVERVLQGDVPIRDFASYDIGRYYWSAAFLLILHLHGFVALHASALAFGALGIAAGAVFVCRSRRAGCGDRVAAFVLCLCLFVVWLTPWWKAYDIVTSIVLVIGLAWLLGNPAPQRWFWYGLMLGLVAVLGRNHGAYGVIATCLAAGFMLLRHDQVHWVKSLTACAGGVALGYSPVLIECIVDPKFAKMFWFNTWSLLLAHGTTNLYLPVPWPWRIEYSAMHLTVSVLQELIIGLFFVALIVFCAIGLGCLLWRSRRPDIPRLPAFTAAVCVAIPYLNVAFSRADVSHFCQAGFPALIGCLVVSTRGSRRLAWWTGMVVLLACSLIAVLPRHAAYRTWTSAGWEQINVGGDQFLVTSSTSQVVRTVEQVSRACLAPDQTVLAAPTWPGIYALLKVRAPVWDIYPTLSRPGPFQQHELDRLRSAKPAVAFINNAPIDGRTSLLYEHTHPEIWKYLEHEYVPFDLVGMPASMRIFVLRGSRCEVHQSNVR